MKEPKSDTELLNYLISYTSKFRELQKISRRIRKIDENDCNGYIDLNGNWSEKAEKIADNKKTKLLKKSSEIAEAIGLKVYHQADPRGCSLYLITEEDALKGSNWIFINGIAVY